MPSDLEQRLERAADDLPTPTDQARERAREAALGALGSSRGVSRQSNRRRAGLVAAAGAITAAAAVTVLLMAPWQRAPLTTERALAALGAQPVIHAVVERSRPYATVVDLASGETSDEFHRYEVWYDEGRGLLRARIMIGGELLTEVLESATQFYTDLGPRERPRPHPPRLDPALAGFATRYRDALESGRARVIGEDVVDGRKAIILRVSLREGPSGQTWQDVAVDADDYRPLRFRFSSMPPRDRPREWTWRVVEIEAISRDPHDFRPPKRAEPRPRTQTGREERTLTPAEAAQALERPALWPGAAVEQLALSKIELMRLTTRWADGRVTKSRALVIQYGGDRRGGAHGEPSLIITEGTSVEATRGPFAGTPPARGKLWLHGLGMADGSDADVWFGTMQRDGVYISLESPQRELIVAAARAMAPIR